MKTVSRLAALLLPILLCGALRAAVSDSVLFAIETAGTEGAVRARWTGPVVAERARDAGGSVLRVGGTAYGGFAEAALEESGAWADAEAVEIIVEVATYGVFSAKLIERDGEGLEGWTVRADLEPGIHTVRRRLQAAPNGDLQAATPVGDGVWNPGPEGVDRLRLGFSGGATTIRSIRLTSRSR